MNVIDSRPCLSCFSKIDAETNNYATHIGKVVLTECAIKLSPKMRKFLIHSKTDSNLTSLAGHKSYY